MPRTVSLIALRSPTFEHMRRERLLAADRAVAAERHQARRRSQAVEALVDALSHCDAAEIQAAGALMMTRHCSPIEVSS